MRIKGLELQAIESAAKDLGLHFDCRRIKGNYVVGRLMLGTERENYRRFSASAFHHRKVNGVCWHGHRDFYYALFGINPKAIIVTSFARYNGEEDFENKFRDTYYHNAGSQMFPRDFGSLCEC